MSAVACGNQKILLDSMKLELQVVIKYNVSPRDQMSVLWINSIGS